MRSRTDTMVLIGVSLLFTPACGSSHAAHNNKPVAGPSATSTPTATQIALDECGLKTQWPGDQYCINAPAPDKGFQLHTGPSNYDNPEAQYLLQPGDETVENIPLVSGNTTDVYFYFRQYRMRPGSHHLIISAGVPGSNGSAAAALLPGASMGRQLGGSQNLAIDEPRGGVIAPENQGVGIPLAANTAINFNLHYMNYTNKPIIKEVWVNFWYRDPSEVTTPTNIVFSPTPMNVPPGEHQIIDGRCAVNGAGRVLNLAGHRHANNLRFSIWRERGSQTDLIYEDYDWEHPLALEFSSLVQNISADPGNNVAGGWSGILDLQDGDHLAFECDIVNNTDQTFVGKNEAKSDEMCIMFGDSIGSTVPFQCASTTTKL